MQSPPPYVPVVEYVLRALEHPPYMYVSKLVACCTILFLTREDPELLKSLSHKWAIRFQQDRCVLIDNIRARATYCINSPDASTELDVQSGKLPSDEDASSCAASSSRDPGEEGQDEEEEGGEEAVVGGIRCCAPDRAVEHLLSILNTLVPMYFSWNWHRADYVIQINKEYEAYVKEFILPVCANLGPEEGTDDEERTPWLLPPHTYLDPSQTNYAFYTPTTAGPSFSNLKGLSHTDTRFGRSPNQNFGTTSGSNSASGGRGGPGISTPGISSPTSAYAPLQNGTAANPPSELHGLSCSGVSNHFSGSGSTRRVVDRHGAANTVASNLPRFSPLHPQNVARPQLLDALPKSSSTASNNSAQSPSIQTNNSGGSSGFSGLPAVSPNIRSAGVFTASAVYGLRFLTLSNYREALEHNSRGLVTVFHAKYSVKSNEVIETLEKIVTKRLLNPMPTFAVVYAVAEPELSSLYKVAWFPTIVYTPPNASQHKDQGHRHAEHTPKEGPTRSLPALPKRLSNLNARERRHHARRPTHSHRSPRSATKATLTASDLAADRFASGTGSALRLNDAAVLSTKASVAVQDGSAQSPASPLSCTGSTDSALTPLDTPVHQPSLSPVSPPVVLANQSTFLAAPVDGQMSGTVPTLCSHVDNSSVSLRSTISGPLAATAAMAPSPTELLFGISVGEQTPCHGDGPSGDVSSQLASVTVDKDSALDCFGEPTLTRSGTHIHRHQPLLDMEQQDNYVIYPLRGELTIPALVEWISARGASVPRLGKLRDVSTCIKAIRQEEKFKRFRELHSAVVTLRRLQGQGDLAVSGSDSGANSAPRSPSQQSPQQITEPPLFIFLGGGMAAGKTTAVAALAKSTWWQGHKEQSVVVNADEFKLPLECEMSSVAAHEHSTRAAENLLVKAINQGRSIVLDGTMMWKPFVQQVVNMVRTAHLSLFKQGPGCDPKTQVEQYFVAAKARQPPLPFPYKIVFLGITVDVETAVPRGFMRKFSSNRGVPISMQLRSFKMFSENFFDYVNMVDSATLYNNNVFVDLEKGELPPVMVEYSEETGHQLCVHDEAAFQQFLKQQHINEDADNAMQVYTSSPVSSRTSADKSESEK